MTQSPPAGPTRREAAEAVLALCDVMARLRADCSWDRAQDLHSLRPYLIEEAHEVLEVLDQLAPDGSGDWEEHRDELGDLLFQIVFQAEIQREAGRFDVGHVAEAIRAKLVRRHPHVFGSESGTDTIGWEAIKAEERAAKGKRHESALDGVPGHLPALLRAYRLGQKANRVGFDWPDWRGVLAKIREELAEIEETLDPEPDRARFEEEVGDLLYAVVNLCRHLEVDPEAALRGTMTRFRARFRLVEESLAAEGKRPEDADLDDLEARWQRAKRALKD